MDKDKLLEEVKVFKFITDADQDGLIRLIIDDSIARILAKVNAKADIELTELPDTVAHIVRDVAIKRYNKLNSEGATADSEEGRSFTWENSYLDEYADELSALATRRRVKGVARFI